MLKYPIFNSVSKLIFFVLSAIFYSVLFVRFGASDFATVGQISIGYGLISLLDFGSNLSLTKDIKAHDGGGKLRAVELFYLLISILVLIGMRYVNYLSGDLTDKWALFCKNSFYISIIFICKFYQTIYLNTLLGLRDLKNHLKLSLILSSATTLVVLILLEFLGYSLRVYLQSLAVISVLIVVISQFVVWSKLKESFFVKPNWTFYSSNRKFNFYIIVNSALGIVLSNFDKYFVLRYLSLEQLSLYTLVSKMTSPMSVIFTSYGQGLLSPLSQLWSEGSTKKFYIKSLKSSRFLLLILLLLIASILYLAKFYFSYLNISKVDMQFAYIVSSAQIIAMWFNAITTTLIYSSISKGDSKSQVIMNLIVGPLVVFLFAIFAKTSVYSVFYIIVFQNILYLLIYFRLIRNSEFISFQRKYFKLIFSYTLLMIAIIAYHGQDFFNIYLDTFFYIFLVVFICRVIVNKYNINFSNFKYS